VAAEVLMAKQMGGSIATSAPGRAQASSNFKLVGPKGKSEQILRLSLFHGEVFFVRSSNQFIWQLETLTLKVQTIVALLRLLHLHTSG